MADTDGAPVIGKLPNPMKVVEQVAWGRASKARWSNSVGAIFMIAFPPLWVHINWAALEYFRGSLAQAIREFASKGLIQFAIQYFPRPSLAALLGYGVWVLCQALLYAYLPGPTCFGQRTPGGHLLSYRTNGLMAWAVSHLLFMLASVLALLDPAVIAINWEGLFVAANTYGLVLAIWAQWKGYCVPTYPEDRKSTGSWLFDFWGGVELNPRIGKNFDLKFYHNGRPGIVAWTLIDLSWAAYQRQTLGYVTNSMLVVLALQTIYVVDFFFNEDWYTRTLDISHDHFGFMLAWGDTTFLPCFYTLQAQYLARYPTHLTSGQAITIFAVGLAGYSIFRWANHERDYVRSRDGDATLWGRPAQFIRVTYRTADNKEHNSILITSGWWGVCRHTNYFADLVLSMAMCASCGFKHALPWSYFIFMCILLHHRAGRDERRCRNKYGKYWEQYCEQVPYRIVPWVY